MIEKVLALVVMLAACALSVVRSGPEAPLWALVAYCWLQELKKP